MHGYRQVHFNDVIMMLVGRNVRVKGSFVNARGRLQYSGCTGDITNAEFSVYVGRDSKNSIELRFTIGDVTDIKCDNGSFIPEISI